VEENLKDVINKCLDENTITVETEKYIYVLGKRSFSAVYSIDIIDCVQVIRKDVRYTRTFTIIRYAGLFGKDVYVYNVGSLAENEIYKHFMNRMKDNNMISSLSDGMTYQCGGKRLMCVYKSGDSWCSLYAKKNQRYGIDIYTLMCSIGVGKNCFDIEYERFLKYVDSKEMVDLFNAFTKKPIELGAEERELVRKFFGEKEYNRIYEPIVKNDEVEVHMGAIFDNIDKDFFSDNYYSIYLAQTSEQDKLMDRLLTIKYTKKEILSNNMKRRSIEYDTGYVVLSKNGIKYCEYYLKTKYGDVKFDPMYLSGIMNKYKDNKYIIQYKTLKEEFKKDIKLMISLGGGDYQSFYANYTEK